MSDSPSQQPTDFPSVGKGVMEFTYRFLTIMLNNKLMNRAEAEDMMDGVRRAMETGWQTPGVIAALQQALGPSVDSGIDSLLDDRRN